MTEQFRPHPENPKQNRPEAGAGLPPLDPEQAPQGGGSTSPERLPQQTTPQEQAKPKPESPANPSPTPLYELKSSQEEPRKGKLSEGKIEKLSGDLDSERESAKMPRITTSNVEQFLQSLEKQFSKSQEVTVQEQESQEIEESIRKLKALKTMSQRIDYLTDPPLEHLKKLWQHDPEYMYPILKGLVRRNDRIKKRDRLFSRITEGDMSGRQPPDYTDLSMRLHEWYFEHPEQFRKIFNSPNYRLLEVMQALSYAVDRAGDEDCNELAGIQNALVCEHDFISALQEAGVEIPKVVTKIHRRLEKRRAFLDPGSTKDRHL
jgi:hypothetical protein